MAEEKITATEEKAAVKVKKEKKLQKEKKPTIKKDVVLPPIKLFGKWDSSVDVNDAGLKKYINLKPRILPRSAGIFRKRFHKSKMHIVERFALHMLVPGHMGKKHRLTSGHMAGNVAKIMKNIESAFDVIEAKEKKSPVEVLVRAIENAAVREEVMSYQIGSITARDAVISSPQRRIDKTLENFARGIYRRTFKKNKTLSDVIAEELIAASHNSADSFAIKEKERIEREATGSR
ncbi:MAG: 30S ribosomal protein S7 [Candidatus Aenigmatarchaeota archaeon]